MKTIKTTYYWRSMDSNGILKPITVSDGWYKDELGEYGYPSPEEAHEDLITNYKNFMHGVDNIVLIPFYRVVETKD